MTKHIVPPLDENTRRYYLDVMGVQCWQSLEPAHQPEQQSAPEQNKGHNDGSELESAGVTATAWISLEQHVQNCDRCVLHKTRKQALIGRGKRSAELMFVLLAPDTSDDRNGRLCSDSADDLLSKMLSAIDIDINDVYITSLLKCSVPDSHTVSPKEIFACTEYLKWQVELIRPELIVVLGETAIRSLRQKDLTIDDFRDMNPDAVSPGKDEEQHYCFESIPVFVSYSPQDLLMKPEHKRKAWSDLQQLQAMMSDRK